eukprot:CAMPEP_0174263684 /NCGR_PEP_ID=MMETSP0439-20130205/19654_1 /TAXON_ID=0 /ORGANISM="Stereomyxa ramosa, Strain Chinc5" /LENGTH=220 /DNA_ID=CAMNT_0015349157 /DNA_START=425 /DNA_END=1087 /DNA_ORIENTATION=-
MATNSHMPQALLKLQGLRLVLVELQVFFQFRADSGPTVHHNSIVEMKDADFCSSRPTNIRPIFPRFPGLQQLYYRGHKDHFFLIKFGVNLSLPNVEGFYGVSSKYNSFKSMSIKCSSKVFFNGEQIVEKIQVEHAMMENNLFTYLFNKSPLCQQLVSVVEEVKSMEHKEQANELLRNVSILQTIIDRETHDVLFTVAFLFEVSSEDHRSHYEVYKLTDLV